MAPAARAFRKDSDMPPYNRDDYIDVQERINRFWHEYPEGAIRTTLASDPANFEICRYRAEVYKQRDNPTPDATGYAFERAGGPGANKNAHEENGETSAIGRALANMGYATSGKDRPSRQEMQKAHQTPPSAPPRPEPPAPDAVDHSSDPAWQKANKRLHAVAANVIGKDVAHDAIKTMTQRTKGVDSHKLLDAAAVEKMATFIESDQFDAYYRREVQPHLPQPQQQEIS